MRLGHFLGAIDIETFRDVEEFKQDVADYVDQLKAVEPRDGFDEVMLPGEIEAESSKSNGTRALHSNRGGREFSVTCRAIRFPVSQRHVELILRSRAARTAEYGFNGTTITVIVLDNRS
jgi:hypothetical protein